MSLTLVIELIVRLKKEGSDVVYLVWRHVEDLVFVQNEVAGGDVVGVLSQQVQQVLHANNTLHQRINIITSAPRGVGV